MTAVSHLKVVQVQDSIKRRPSIHALLACPFFIGDYDMDLLYRAEINTS
jgi:hypothetical protein